MVPRAANAGSTCIIHGQAVLEAEGEEAARLIGFGRLENEISDPRGPIVRTQPLRRGSQLRLALGAAGAKR